jgi:hypothetical protein
LKSSGLGDNFYIAGYDLSGDINSLGNIGGGPALLEVTGINKSAFERIGGVRDGRIEFVAYFNPTLLTGAHARLSTLPTADVIVTYCHGTTLGNDAASIVAKQINYDGTRGNDGDFKFAVQAQANGFGLEWGRQGTAGIRTDTTATNGSSLDDSAATTFGLQAYLQVFAFTGTSATVTVQDSPDNSTFTNVVGGSFTAATAITSQRIATATNLSVARYLRVVTTGTFSNVQFAVNIVRNATAPAF